MIKQVTLGKPLVNIHLVVRTLVNEVMDKPDGHGSKFGVGVASRAKEKVEGHLNAGWELK